MTQCEPVHAGCNSSHWFSLSLKKCFKLRLLWMEHQFKQILSYRRCRIRGWGGRQPFYFLCSPSSHLWGMESIWQKTHLGTFFKKNRILSFDRIVCDGLLNKSLLVHGLLVRQAGTSSDSFCFIVSDQLLRTCTKSVHSKPNASFIEKNTGACEGSCDVNESRVSLHGDWDPAYFPPHTHTTVSFFTIIPLNSLPICLKIIWRGTWAQDWL